MYIINKKFNGFVLTEIMLAFSLFSLLTVTSFTLKNSIQGLKIWSLNELMVLKDLVHKFDKGEFDSFYDYGNYTKVYEDNLFRLSSSDYLNAWGRDGCHPRLKFNLNKTNLYNTGIYIGNSNISTDIEGRNGIAYLTADSSILSLPDLFIVDTRDPGNLKIISTLNTGPGLVGLEVVGPYIFAAQASTVNQMQIIDIHDRSNPKLISQLKLPLPTSSTTAPFASSIFYSNGFVYLGTAKWNGAEFSIIDVSNITSPHVVGQLEIGTLVNDIYIKDNTAYLASSDDKQLRVIDISDKNNPVLIDYFLPSGWQTQEGKTLDYFEGILSLGRTVGGFNVSTNYEAYMFSTSSTNLSQNTHRDVPGGVYSILKRGENIFLLTHSTNKEFQVFNSSFTDLIFSLPLGSYPSKFTCDGTKIYFATGNQNGLSILDLNN